MRATKLFISLFACGLWSCHGNASLRAADPLKTVEFSSTVATAQPADDSPASASSLSLAAPSLAERVLAAEADGDLRERSRLILDLLESEAEDDLSHSVTGEIHDRSGWKSVEAQVEENRGLPAIERYERFRSSQPDSVRGHLEVAAWCHRTGLKTQCSAHCRRVLQLDPENQIARAALGHRRIDGRWITPEQMAELKAEVAALRASLSKHGGKLMKLAAEMRQERQEEREVAVESFMKIDDVDAIPAVAAVFSATPRPLIDHAIAWMSAMRDPAATAVLAQWSVDHPESASREQCAAALERRPAYQYVPLLLERARSPLVSTIIPSFRPDGSLAGVRHVFAREAKDNFDVTVVDSVNVRRLNIQRPSGENRGSSRMEQAVEMARAERENQINNALIDRQNRAAATREAMQREQIAAAENQTSTIVNDRIRFVLSKTSGTDPEATLNELWDWWADYTEREPAPIKLASYRYNMRLSQSSFYATRAPAPEIPHECFVAGTPVVTSRGEKPIESIVVGDEVLSKNIDTGELVWDVVLTTTEQPAKPLVTVLTDQDKFQCTGGHLFWVSGKGWTKARDLEYQDLLHGLTRPTRVQSVAEGEAEPTYNLVTATHHNYFVGKSQSLSHDFNEPTPTAVRVPGLHPAADR